MNRRDILKQIVSLSASVVTDPSWAKAKRPEIAFTFDDPKTDSAGSMSWKAINDGILGALARHNIKAVLFVTGKRVDSQEGSSLVAAWDRAGHTIGNHSYSHLSFSSSRVSLEQFETDVLKNEPLIHGYRHFKRIFRFPYFKEGDTANKRDGMRSFLRHNCYEIGRATVDASDWAISARLEKRLAEDPKSGINNYGEFLKQHIWERAQFYDSLARRVLGHSVHHTVLLHHNALNALFLDPLVVMLKERGWKPIDALRAYADPVYQRQPAILPAGESLIWALAKETGKFESELRYPGEDDVYENPKMDALGL